MGKFILPFYESLRGWYEIEADSIEEARKLADDYDYIAELEPNYKDGEADWDANEITEATDSEYYKQWQDLAKTIKRSRERN